MGNKSERHAVQNQGSNLRDMSHNKSRCKDTQRQSSKEKNVKKEISSLTLDMKQNGGENST